MKKRLKINGVIIFIAFAAILAFPTFFLRYNRFGSRDIIAQIVGIALILLGQFFRVSARGFKAENSEKGRALIVGGPYALVRNPMYLGILLIGLGVVFVIFKWWVILIFLSVFTVRYILLIFSEEEKLLSVFSKEFSDYCNIVPRIFPSPRALLKRDVVEYLPLKQDWLKKEIGSILATLLMTLLIDLWLDARKKGLNAYSYELFWASTIILLFALLAVYLIKRTKESRDVSVKS